MKIYLLRQHSKPFGGAEAYLSRLSSELERQGIEHEVIHSKAPLFLASWIRALLFNLQVCLTKKNRFYFSLERITCPDLYRAGDGVHKAYMERLKIQSFNPLHWVYLFLERRCFEKSRCIIANSQMVKREIMEHYQIPSEKIEVVYNGVPLKESDPLKAKKELSREFGINEESKILLFVGSGFERKGVASFLKLLSTLEGNFIAFVVGKEKRMSRYEALAESLGLKERVIFTGARGDVERFYAASDIFLFPTHYEPFSNVVLEALSQGCVVFTTAQNGASEILPQEQIMKDPSDLGIQKHLQELLYNPSLLEQKKGESKKIAQGFGMEANVQKSMEIITRLIHD